MKTNLYKITASGLAITFSFLTVTEGSMVLLGITIQDYKVFLPLLVYNVIMGVVGLFVGAAIWVNHKKAIATIKMLLIIHSAVFVIVSVLYLYSDVVAMHSVQAMIIRVVVWVVISIMVLKINQSRIKDENNKQTNRGYSDEQ